MQGIGENNSLSRAKKIKNIIEPNWLDKKIWLFMIIDPSKQYYYGVKKEFNKKNLWDIFLHSMA